jgi:hypothetical protein
MLNITIFLIFLNILLLLLPLMRVYPAFCLPYRNYVFHHFVVLLLSILSILLILLTILIKGIPITFPLLQVGCRGPSVGLRWLSLPCVAFVGCRQLVVGPRLPWLVVVGSLLAFVGCCGPSIGLRWLSLACVGLHRSSLVFVGCRGPVYH